MIGWQVDYRDVDGRVARMFVPLLCGSFAAGAMYFLILLVLFPPADPLAAVAIASVLLVALWLFGWLTARLAVVSWRSGRGVWWLRLSSRGFEVNDRVFKPRHYGWDEIEKFMLVAPAGTVDQAVLAPATTFADGLKNPGDQLPCWQVGFSFSGHRRRPIAVHLFQNFRDRDGTRVDGMIMGFWDRPFDEAVDLMNQWRVRYSQR